MKNIFLAVFPFSLTNYPENVQGWNLSPWGERKLLRNCTKILPLIRKSYQISEKTQQHTQQFILKNEICFSI